MALLDHLFAENCRVCHKLIPARTALAKTLCDTCWLPLVEQEPQVDNCFVPGFESIAVAHAANYAETLKLLLYKLKYDDDRLIAEDLAILLHRALDQISLSSDSAPQLVPIPLSRWRRIKRGYNQSELLAKYLSKSKSTSLRLNIKLLKRVKDTKAQHNLSKPERYLNLEGAFACNNLDPKSSVPYILIDDIHTSGSTLAEAARTLFTAGATNVSALTVARAPLHGTKI